MDADGVTDCEGDCDDADAGSYPGAAEVCDGVDNDCDGALPADEQDVDADGVSECDGDCDDADAASYPGATEVCDGVDNDCDGALPADEQDVDADGVTECEGDCDDGDEDSYPGATELCDGVDNDCDGALPVDEQDVDADGYSECEGDCDDADANVNPDAAEVCDEVDNDCDGDEDEGFDQDADGVADCVDPDIDGDGLRNEWDADEYDDSVVRGPNQGLGSDGALTVSGTVTLQDWTLLDGGAAAGDPDIDVDDATAFAEGDELLVLSQQGTDAGLVEFVFVGGVTGNTLTVEPDLLNGYDASSVVLVQRVPHYTDVDVPSGTELTGDAWAGDGGGVVAFRATGDVAVTGTVHADALGFTGGDGVYGNDYDPYQGESHGGLGAAGDTSANDGGGGAYPRRGDNADSGGGGGYGTDGEWGTSYGGSAVCEGGIAHGDAELLDWYVGSGGGGGSPDTEGDGDDIHNYSGDGGNGGGLVAIWCGGTLAVDGVVSANGEDGDDAFTDGYWGENGGGGAGSGGQVLLAASSISHNGAVEALGGEGGLSASQVGIPYGSALGGDGGDGRIRLDYDELNGVAYPGGDETLTSPTAGFEGDWEE